MDPGYQWRAARRSFTGERSKYVFLAGLGLNLLILAVAGFDAAGTTVVVESNLPDATCVVGGEPPVSAMNPARFERVPYGRHEVTVQRQYYRPVSVLLDVGWFSGHATQATLVPLPVELEIRTQPGAEVLVDGRAVGRAAPDGRFQLADAGLGRHVVVVRLKGYTDWSGQHDFYPPRVPLYAPLRMTDEARVELQQRRERMSRLMFEARNFFSAGQYQEALAALDQVLAIQPDDDEALRLRGQVQQTMDILNVR